MITDYRRRQPLVRDDSAFNRMTEIDKDLGRVLVRDRHVSTCGALVLFFDDLLVEDTYFPTISRRISRMI